ncbi:hypothetical protein DITRI_Ditri19aG0194100 [Diplodiscus trichospermus]
MMDGLGGKYDSDSALGNEVFACREGVKLAKRRGYSKNVIEEIRIGLREFEAKKFKYIKRAVNKAADWVARQSKEEMCPENWLERPPSSLVFILDKYGMLAPY